MSSSLYLYWDWENDKAETPIESAAAAQDGYVEVFLDWRGFVYRVMVHSQINPEDSARQLHATFVYDYFCDDQGRITEKRSLDNFGTVVTIVRYEYDKDKKVAEIGWSPQGDFGPKRIKWIS